MINKISDDALAAVSCIEDGHVVLVGGFGDAGNPIELLHALAEHGSRDLTIVNNNAGAGYIGLARLFMKRQVSKLVCTYPRNAHNYVFAELYEKGQIELELVPQGTLAERLRAGGAGLPAFYTPTAVGTELATGKEIRRFDDRDYLLEYAIRGDVALIKAEVGDRWGNLTYRKAARNFSPVMAMAANKTIAQVRRIVGLGEIDPEHIITPSIFVDSIVPVANPMVESEHLLQLESAR